MSYQKGSIEHKVNGTYLLRYRMRDASRPGGWRKVAETMDATTPKAAAKERDRRMRAVNAANEERAAAPAPDPKLQIPTFLTFSETLWTTYLGNRRIKPSTRAGYASVLARHLVPAFGEERLDAITPADVSLFFTELGERFSTKFVLNVYAQLRVMFEVAVEYDLLAVAPVRKKLHRPKHQMRRKPALSAEEVRQLLANIPVMWQALFVCLALTNVRIGELLALQWQDVDWEQRTLAVTKTVWRGRLQHSTKTGEDLTKHLPETLLTILRWHRERSPYTEPGDYLFPKQDGAPSDPNFVRESVLYPAMDRTGIERGDRTHGFHIFRHSAGSIIHKKTGSMKLAQIQLGHADMGTTANIYVHTDEEEARYAAEVLAEAIRPGFCPPICPPNAGGLPTSAQEVR